MGSSYGKVIVKLELKLNTFVHASQNVHPRQYYVSELIAIYLWKCMFTCKFLILNMSLTLFVTGYPLDKYNNSRYL